MSTRSSSLTESSYSGSFINTSLLVCDSCFDHYVCAVQSTLEVAFLISSESDCFHRPNGASQRRSSHFMHLSQNLKILSEMSLARSHSTMLASGQKVTETLCPAVDPSSMTAGVAVRHHTAILRYPFPGLLERECWSICVAKPTICRDVIRKRTICTKDMKSGSSDFGPESK